MPTPFIGEIDLFAGNFAPSGYAFCDGQLLAISQNTALFSLLGTFYGGDGISTFALPDLRGRRPIHEGQGPGLQDYTIGQVGGEEMVTLLVGELPVHGHTPRAASAASSTDPTGRYWAPSASDQPYGELTPAGPTKTANSTQMAANALTPAGGGQPHENRPPTLAVNFIIALRGIFPARN